LNSIINRKSANGNVLTLNANIPVPNFVIVNRVTSHAAKDSLADISVSVFAGKFVHPNALLVPT
jgi:hypothetical protein